MKSWHIGGKTLPVIAVLVYLFLWLPVIILIIFSFSADKFGIRWEGFTLHWYANLLQNVGVRHALRMSVTVAIITMIAATVLGTLAAYGLYKYKFRGMGALRMGSLLPIVTPWVVTGAALLLFYTRVLPIPLGYPSILIAHITFSFPLALFVILGRMQRIDWTLEEASADLGASRLTTWRKITLPLLLPAIIASVMLIFPWSFSDFTITFFVSGIGTTTLPIYVYSQMRYGATPVINTIGTIFVAAPLIAMLLMNFLQRRRAA